MKDIKKNIFNQSIIVPVFVLFSFTILVFAVKILGKKGLMNKCYSRCLHKNEPMTFLQENFMSQSLFVILITNSTTICAIQTWSRSIINGLENMYYNNNNNKTKPASLYIYLIIIFLWHWTIFKMACSYMHSLVSINYYFDCNKTKKQRFLNHIDM
jgi:hypothetical protein